MGKLYNLKRILLLCLCLIFAACNTFVNQSPVSIPDQPLTTTSVSWTDTPEAAFTSEETSFAVSILIHEVSDSRTRINKSVGDFAEVVLESSPVIYSISRRSDRSVQGTSMLPWESYNVSEMQVCFSLDVPCQLTGEWIPFELSPNVSLFGEASIQKFKIQVDWVGPRTLWVVTQFRDKSGNPVLSVGSSYEDPEVISQKSIEIIGIPNEATPIEGQPPVVQTAIAETKTAFPLTGFVQVGGGACCVAGTDGDTIEVQVNFSAASHFGEVEEMRVQPGGCFSESEMTDVNWEPFVSSKTYPVYVAINWTSFLVSAQYRDNHGNLSPVYCDDIGVEGFPSTPTNTSTP